MPTVSLDSGPLLYFLLHGTTFVIVLGTVFFVLGFGFCWPLLKVSRRRVSAQNEELAELHSEVAKLRRLIAESALSIAPQATTEGTVLTSLPLSADPESESTQVTKEEGVLPTHLRNLMRSRIDAASHSPQPIRSRTHLFSDPEDAPKLGELGPTFLSRPPHADDLTLIKGIGPVLARRLNEHGIYTFRQIANWGPKQVHSFSRLLAFKDRIQREGWVDQARAHLRVDDITDS